MTYVAAAVWLAILLIILASGFMAIEAKGALRRTLYFIVFFAMSTISIGAMMEAEHKAEDDRGRSCLQ